MKRKGKAITNASKVVVRVRREGSEADCALDLELLFRRLLLLLEVVLVALVLGAEDQAKEVLALLAGARVVQASPQGSAGEQDVALLDDRVGLHARGALFSDLRGREQKTGTEEETNFETKLDLLRGAKHSLENIVAATQTGNNTCTFFASILLYRAAV